MSGVGTAAPPTGARHLPFGFTVEGPDDWMLLETTPAAWQTSRQRLLHGLPPAVTKVPGARSMLSSQLDAVVGYCQQVGAVLCLIDTGMTGHREAPSSDGDDKRAAAPLSDAAENVRRGSAPEPALGQVYSASLVLAFTDTSPVPASPALVREAFHRPSPGQSVVPFDLPRENLEPQATSDPQTVEALMVTETKPWGPELRRMYGRAGESVSAQAYVPIPGTTWTAVIAGTSSLAPHRDVVESVVARMAHTFTITSPPPTPAPDPV